MAFDILDAYWVAGTNPTTQVFSTAAGVEDFVANNAAAYQTWLAAGNFGTLRAITAESAGTAGTVRLTLDASQLQTGQRAQIAGLTGSPLANGFRQFNLIDATHIDLVGTTFVATASPTAATLAMAAILATDAALWVVFDAYAQQAYKGAALSVTQTANYVIPNPMASDLTITLTSTNHDVTLPNFRSPRAPPIGGPFTIRNGSAYPGTGAYPGQYLRLLLNDGTTVLGFVDGNKQQTFQLQDNSTKNGTLISPPSPAKIGYFTSGLFISRSGGQQLSVNSDQAVLRDANGDQLFIWGGATFANTSFQGAGGRDQAAAFTVSTDVYAYLIAGRSQAVNGLTSASYPPTLPTGYTHYCMIGKYRLDGAGLFRDLWQRGNTVYFLSPPLALNAGTNTAGYGGLGGAGQVLLATGLCPDAVADVILDVDSFKMTATAGGVIDATLGISIDGVSTHKSRKFLMNGLGASAAVSLSSGEIQMSSGVTSGTSRFWYNVTVTSGTLPEVTIRLCGYRPYGVLASG